MAKLFVWLWRVALLGKMAEAVLHVLVRPQIDLA
jgi:hypothetical protein